MLGFVETVLTILILQGLYRTYRMYVMSQEMHCIHDFVHTLWEFQEELEDSGYSIILDDADTEEELAGQSEIEAWDMGITNEEE
jgi:hypothetical protein